MASEPHALWCLVRLRAQRSSSPTRESTRFLQIVFAECLCSDAGLRALEDASFDLMIVDIFMPHMRGFESIRIFHERAPSVPLVAMSGYAFANADSPAPDFLRMALELGAIRCLRKPFTPVVLMTVVNECLAESRSRHAGIARLL